jgi:hypothetical protein
VEEALDHIRSLKDSLKQIYSEDTFLAAMLASKQKSALFAKKKRASYTRAMTMPGDAAPMYVTLSFAELNFKLIVDPF